MIDTIQKPAYHWLLHPDSAHAVTNYRQQLAEQGLAQAGAYLREQLSDQAPGSLSDAAFHERLVNTKRPLIFAESAVYGDGRDWSPTELSLLGDLGVAVPVRIFDDGRHHRPAVHPEPLSGTLLFIPEVFGLAYPEPAAVKQADLAVLAAEREQVLGPSYGPWFKNFPEPAPITIKPCDWLEIKASFGQALQTEITTRRAATDPRQPGAAAESLGELRPQEARA